MTDDDMDAADRAGYAKGYQAALDDVFKRAEWVSKKRNQTRQGRFIALLSYVQQLEKELKEKADDR